MIIRTLNEIIFFESFNASAAFQNFTDTSHVDAGLTDFVHEKITHFRTAAYNKAPGADESHGMDIELFAYLCGLWKNRDTMFFSWIC